MAEGKSKTKSKAKASSSSSSSSSYSSSLAASGASLQESIPSAVLAVIVSWVAASPAELSLLRQVSRTFQSAVSRSVRLLAPLRYEEASGEFIRKLLEQDGGNEEEYLPGDAYTFDDHDPLPRLLPLPNKSKVKAKAKAGKKAAAKPLEGKKVCFTGKLEGMTRKEAGAMVEGLGGKVVGSISKNTDIVVVGDAAGSKKAKAEALVMATICMFDEHLEPLGLSVLFIRAL